MVYYSVYIAIISIIANYVFSCLGYGCILKRRNIKGRALAFIPIINDSFVLGRIYDDISNDYKQKTKSAWKLLIVKLISLTSLACFFLILVFNTSVFNNLSPDYNIYLQSVETLQPPLNYVFMLLIFITFATNILYLVYYFQTLYGVYKEYAKSRAVLYFLVSVFGELFFNIGFLSSLFVFISRNNTPEFDLLNSKSSYNQH